jgi:hypothetical protein
LSSHKEGEKARKLDAAKAKTSLTKPQLMASFFNKKTGNELSKEQVTLPCFALLVSSPLENTCMGLFPKTMTDNSQWQSAVTIYGNYAIAGNEFKFLLCQNMVTPLGDHISLQNEFLDMRQLLDY